MFLFEELRLQKIFKELEKYIEANKKSKKPIYFITFQDHLKLGINPTGSFVYEFNFQPLGIYLLPLRPEWTDFKSFLHGEDLHFIERKYLFVVKPKSNANVMYLSDFPYPHETWNEIIEQAQEKYPQAKLPVALTKYLREQKIDMVVDDYGHVISNPPYEKYQAVVINPSAIEVVDVFDTNPEETQKLKHHGDRYDAVRSIILGMLVSPYNLTKEDLKELQTYYKLFLSSEEVGNLFHYVFQFVKDFQKIFSTSVPKPLMAFVFLTHPASEKIGFDLNVLLNQLTEDIKSILEAKLKSHKEKWSENDMQRFSEFMKKYGFDKYIDVRNLLGSER